MPQIYIFRSKNTNYYLISTVQDVNGGIIRTVNGKFPLPIPLDSTLTVTPAITGEVTEVTITGVRGLYVSLQGDAENTKLTWSDKEYKWIIRVNQNETNYVNPVNGADLYWFDEFGTGDVVIVKAGKDIRPPQAEWFVAMARLSTSASASELEKVL